MSRGPVVAGDLYVSGTFWLTVVLIVIGLLALGVAYLTLVKDRQRLGWQASAVPLLREDRPVSDQLTVSWQGHGVSDPTVQTIHLSNRGRTDIGSSAFDGGRPIVLDFGDTLLALLQPQANKNDLLPLRRVEGRIEVGPGLIKKGEEVSIVVLTDSTRPFRREFPLEGVNVAETPSPAEIMRRSNRAWRVQTVANVLFVAFLAFRTVR